jgi:hypothetical protein
MMGWDVKNLIVPQTAEDKQRVQQKNQAAARAQGQMQLQQQVHQDDLENIDAKGSAQAGVAVVRSVLKNGETQASQQIEAQQAPEGIQ